MELQNSEIKMKQPVTRLIVYFVFLVMFYAPAYAQYTKLFNFAGTSNGSYPWGSLISDGTFLYGMTYGGGANGYGTIFKIKPDGSGFVKLLDFDDTNTGRYPCGSLISDGTFLYGMARNGGANERGTIFKIKPDGTGFVKLLDFDGKTNGSGPYSSLISDGAFLYGMTNGGGRYGYGTIFKIKPDGTGYVKLLDFDGIKNGRSPFGSLISDGTFLYGTTSGSSISDSGTIFKIKPDGTGYVKLLDFYSIKNGRFPYGSLISDGTFLYGTAFSGGNNNEGTIFKIKPDGTGFVKLLDFDNTNTGRYPWGSLISDGTFLYGRTYWGGAYGYGTIFKIKPDGTEFVKLYDFDTDANGSYPKGDFIIHGNFLYGMTPSGGTNGFGTIFKYCFRSTYSTDTVTTCGSYLWNGNAYTVSGTYTDTIPNAEGCDSVMTLHLTINTAKSDSLSITSCKSVVSPSGKYTYNSSGYYSDTIPNHKGCDSVLTIYYIRTVINDTVFVKSCDTVVSPSGKYIYRATGIYSDTLVTKQNCDSIITTNLTINPLQLNISKSNNISCDTPYATLSATGADFYYWEPADGLSDVHAANPIATPNFTRTYYVTATNSFGCSVRDSIIVLVEKKDSVGSIPNVFTPNNDGYNDCLNVSALTQFKSIEFTVFNRWGNIVFTTTDPKACWNGKTSSGTDLSEGVYFYMLSGTGHCDEKINRQGTITLIR